MVDFKYLYNGLCGLARAHTANAMAGHLGAAVVAGYFVGEELPELDDRVYAGIENAEGIHTSNGAKIEYLGDSLHGRL